MADRADKADIVFAGGGLAACLTALRISEEFPGCAVAIVESGAQICGNHTWSFHETDLSRGDLERLQPLIAHRWLGQKVRFPGLERRLSTPYCSTTSETLRTAVYANQAITVRENSAIDWLDDRRVRLASGQCIEAACVIDARGFAPSDALSLGFQKFLGLEVTLSEPHGETVPTIMDADVPQRDGYRFVYLLPLSPDRILIEDTRYSDSGALDEEAVCQDVLAYAGDRGWRISGRRRSERGVLPIALAHDVRQFWLPHESGAAPIGLRAGLFHPSTGYSLPECMKVAELIATECKPLTSETVRHAVRSYAFRRNREQAFYRMLNRLLFGAAEPERRYLVLQRFYKLPQGLIERFYAGRLTAFDKVRIMAGKPPVPIHRALRCVEEPKPLAMNP